MMKNQRGFTYPLTLSLLLSFLIFFSIQVDQLLTEEKIFHETKNILLEEYYMFISMKNVEKKLQTGETIAPKGTFPYLNGSVSYQADLPSGSTQKITFTLQLRTGEIIIGIGYFDKNLKKLTKWVEKN
ncbi:MAG: competence type IV pilus minor pilin ComGG [Bacillota bacterium]|nr:competence type IV pilus minor pilin ComGG [Bacillota bacterium]